jgi:hypothetical protein
MKIFSIICFVANAVCALLSLIIGNTSLVTLNVACMILVMVVYDATKKEGAA